ncbi:hypothetical protein GO988_01215 [Hymenobacter sp. HMF4947]|uniref:T9SS type A sorting domain-containing protein n=1 Tax=Hymenobacter ginkgonis TaxID=2682976 RepID=A0A7K1T950_9BACT|nr:hypothetical protein [Hymenobacter ginkgonis]MVN74937.1 hypothetical protein [Hymenobacter ginkgonis]
MSHAQLYANGPFSTGALTTNGTAAPAGYTWSEAPANAGTFGFSATSGINTLADNFTVPAGQPWTLTRASFFPYQTGYMGEASPITALYLRIWNGPPTAVGSAIVFGDLTTNRLVGSRDAQVYRIIYEAAGTTRHVWQVDAAIAPALTLPPGTYWVEWASTALATHYYLPVTMAGQGQVPGADALQSSFGTWSTLTDAGAGASVDFPFQLAISNTPLPVTLVAFSAQAAPGAVRLNWTTASERNSARFVAERSTDAHTFVAIGSVEGAGTTTATHSYALTDAALPPGGPTLYYRLRQVDLDGTLTYSPVQAVESSPGELTLLPNPAHVSARLAGAPAGALVQVFDALGRQVLATTTDAAGTATLLLSRGVYAVRTGPHVRRLLME